MALYKPFFIALLPGGLDLVVAGPDWTCSVMLETRLPLRHAVCSKRESVTASWPSSARKTYSAPASVRHFGCLLPVSLFGRWTLCEDSPIVNGQNAASGRRRWAEMHSIPESLTGRLPP